MGSITGFLDFNRQEENYDAPEKRIKGYQEFTQALSDDASQKQAARCMDCGIPFCHNGCPVNNLIPDWNDLVFKGKWQEASERLHATNNFPEFTGRICPAPCESACTLYINQNAVGIKSIERAIIDKALKKNWVLPQPSKTKTDKHIAVVGSGPAGLACAQQFARLGHTVTVFEKNDRIGGLLRYGIPDFKLNKDLIDNRVEQLKKEGVTFKTSTMITDDTDLPQGVLHFNTHTVSPSQLKKDFDVVVLAGGSETPRDLPIPNRDLTGIHFALEYLIPQNRETANLAPNPINVKGKHVVVIGGGDTGSDCVGTANRQGATKITQIELMPQPPEKENGSLVWPYWPVKLRTSSSHEEGCNRNWSVLTKSFEGNNGKVEKMICSKLTWENGQMKEITGSEFAIKADYVFLAMGFTQPVRALLDSFGIKTDARGNANASVGVAKMNTEPSSTKKERPYMTNVDRVFATGDMRRGQSLVVWAIREGRECAQSVHDYLMKPKD